MAVEGHQYQRRLWYEDLTLLRSPGHPDARGLPIIRMRAGRHSMLGALVVIARLQ